MADIQLKNKNGVDVTYEGVKRITVPSAEPDGEDVVYTNMALQDKTVEITENGFSYIVSDAGYDGLSRVGVRTNVKSGNTAYRLLSPSSIPTITGAQTIVGGGMDILIWAVTVDGASCPVIAVTDENGLSVTGTTLEYVEAVVYAYAPLTFQGVELAAGWTAFAGDVYPNTNHELLPAAATIELPADTEVILPEIFYAAFADAGLQTKAVSITGNGTQIITADTGSKGLYEVDVTVNVPSSGANLQSKDVSVTQNGPVRIAPDTGYDGLSAVNLSVHVPSGSWTVLTSANGGFTMPADWTADNFVSKITVMLAGGCHLLTRWGDNTDAAPLPFVGGDMVDGAYYAVFLIQESGNAITIKYAIGVNGSGAVTLTAYSATVGGATNSVIMDSLLADGVTLNWIEPVQTENE